MMKLGNVDEHATSGITMAIAPKIAYLDATPWWMTFFTMGLLFGRPNIINIRLVPGFCPYRPIMNYQDFYDLMIYLKGYFENLTDSNNAISLIGSPEIMQPKKEYQTTSGF